MKKVIIKNKIIKIIILMKKKVIKKFKIIKIIILKINIISLK